MIGRLRKGKATRAQFIESNLAKSIAHNLRATRDRLEWSQERLAAEVGMNQNAISRLESPDYGKQTITTLKRLAKAMDVALIVRFVPFSELIDWVSGTRRVDLGLATESLAVPSFEAEEEAGVFDMAEPIQPQRAINEVEERALLGAAAQPTKGKLLQFDKDSGHRQDTQGGQENSVESFYAMGA